MKRWAPSIMNTPPLGSNMIALLRPYAPIMSGLVILTLLANGLSLAVPQLMARAIDAYTRGTFALAPWLWTFATIAGGVFSLTYAQSLVQTYASERVARDLRATLVNTLSQQTYASIQTFTPAKLLTNLTSDVEAVKTFVSQAVPSIVSSLFIILGASVLLCLINWKLALPVLAVVPLIGGMFQAIMGRVRKLFRRQQEAIDWLNNVINESIIGSALIRLLNAQHVEQQKFLGANTEAKNIGLSILRLFATLIPLITFLTNLASLTIVLLGGRFVVQGVMTLGDFTAFNSYLAMLIFPIIIIGFMSNVIAQASASYQRIAVVLKTENKPACGTHAAILRGDIAVRDLRLALGGRQVLKGISFEVKAGQRTAIIGPTAAGKTQLMHALIGLVQPQAGSVSYDGLDLREYDPAALLRQIGLVFQDSGIFRLSVRENIAFSPNVSAADLAQASATAELDDFIASLPQGLDTLVSEHGANLSGGQKQRLMLARALAIRPAILLLDDFTARVDVKTEQKILDNIRRDYPGVTLISITQKIQSVETYDQIILLMEGEILARGKHPELLHTSPEYVQLYQAQRSTDTSTCFTN